MIEADVLDFVRAHGPVSTRRVRAAIRARGVDVDGALRALEALGLASRTPTGWEAAGHASTSPGHAFDERPVCTYDGHRALGLDWRHPDGGPLVCGVCHPPALPEWWRSASQAATGQAENAGAGAPPAADQRRASWSGPSPAAKEGCRGKAEPWRKPEPPNRTEGTPMNTTTGDDYTTPEFLSWWLGHPDHQRLFALGMPRSLDDASAWAARRIDLSTALAMRDMVDGFNPYGQYKTHPEYHCFGRECFFWDPHDRIGIREGELAALHPDLSGEEWSEVRANAFRRFAERSACSNSFDPQPDDVPF